MYTINVDNLEGKDFRKRYEVKSIPTFFILQKDGVVRHPCKEQEIRKSSWLERGENETSSLFFLNLLLDQKQKMSLQTPLTII